MNGLLIKIAVAIFALGTILLALSCGTDSASNNSAAPTPSSEDCTKLSGQAKADQLWIWIDAKLKNDPVLSKHYTSLGGPNDPPKLVFGVNPGKYNYYAEVYFKGDVSGDGKFEAISDILDNYMHKRCVQRVLLYPLQTNFAPGLESENSFEWNYCEHPKIPCPDGECRQYCDGMTNTNSGNTGGNGNTNSNSNSNSNANSNSN